MRDSYLNLVGDVKMPIESFNKLLKKVDFLDELLCNIYGNATSFETEDGTKFLSVDFYELNMFLKKYDPKGFYGIIAELEEKKVLNDGE